MKDLKKQVFQPWRSTIEMTTNCFYPNIVFNSRCFLFTLEDDGANILHVVPSLVSYQLRACWIMSTCTLMLSHGQILATMTQPAGRCNTTGTEGGKGRRTRQAEPAGWARALFHLTLWLLPQGVRAVRSCSRGVPSRLLFENQMTVNSTYSQHHTLASLFPLWCSG